MINLKDITKKIFIRENFFLLIIIGIIFFLDRYSKTQIINNFSGNSFYINDFLNFDLIWNTGIGFGLLSSDSNLFYNLISCLIGLVIIFIIIAGINSNKFDKIAFSIITGGALGNFYDRLVYQAVPDFVDFHYSNFHWFAFNVADIFITVGIIAFIINEFFIKNK